jgi:hypothetical protein
MEVSRSGLSNELIRHSKEKPIVRGMMAMLQVICDGQKLRLIRDGTGWGSTRSDNELLYAGGRSPKAGTSARLRTTISSWVVTLAARDAKVSASTLVRYNGSARWSIV